MAKEIIIRLDGGIGASFPNDPVKGRFHMRGKVIEGTKPMLGRDVRIEFTHAQLKSAVNNGASALLRHPHCGTNVPVDEDDF
jgi:hypothetical protein